MPRSSLEPQNNKVVDYDLYDEYKFKDNLESQEKEFFELVDAKKYDEKGITEKSVGNDMMNIFATLFRRHWDWAEGGEEEEDSELKTFLDELTKTEEFENIRSMSVRNDSAAFAASMSLIEKFDRAIKEDIEKENKSGGGPDSSQQGKAKIRAKIRAAAKAAEEAADDADKAEKAFGCGDEDPMNTKGPKELKDRIKKISGAFGKRFFRLLANSIGRMKAFAESTLHSYTDKGSVQPVGVEIGGEIDRVVASELIRYKVAKTAFLVDWLERKLLQIKHEGEEPQSGDIVFVMDQSSSMDGVLRMVACALLYGLWLIAKKQSRRLMFIPFSSSVGNAEEVRKIEDMDDILTQFMGGGTNFDAPIIKAISCVEENPEFNQADIIVVTDGEADISDTTVERVQNLEGKLRLLVAQLDGNELDCDEGGNLVKVKTSYRRSNIGRRDTEIKESVFEKVTPKEHIFHIDNPLAWDKFCGEAFATPGGKW